MGRGGGEGVEGEGRKWSRDEGGWGGGAGGEGKGIWKG